MIPESANLADWLINISTGQVGPSKTVEIENYAADNGLDDKDEENEISSSSAPCKQSVFSSLLGIHGSAVIRKTVNKAMVTPALQHDEGKTEESAKILHESLYDRWIEHFDCQISEEQRKELYDPPEKRFFLLIFLRCPSLNNLIYSSVDPL